MRAFLSPGSALVLTMLLLTTLAVTACGGRINRAGTGSGGAGESSDAAPAPDAGSTPAGDADAEGSVDAADLPESTPGLQCSSPTQGGSCAAGDVCVYPPYAPDCGKGFVCVCRGGGFVCSGSACTPPPCPVTVPSGPCPDTAYGQSCAYLVPDASSNTGQVQCTCEGARGEFPYTWWCGSASYG